MNPEPIEAEDFWGLLSARLTLFPTVPTELPQLNEWWDHVFGIQAEEAQASPRDGKARQSGRVELMGRELRVQSSIEPLRIDWNLLDLRPFEPDGEEIVYRPNVGWDSLREISQRWWPQAPPIRRIALAVSLTHGLAADENPTPILAARTGLALEGDISDFLLQLNRPRPSHVVDGVRLNRVAKWSVVAVQRLIFAIGGQRVDAIQPEFVSHAVQIDLEANSDAAREDALPADSLPALFDELARLVEEIATLGLIA